MQGGVLMRHIYAPRLKVVDDNVVFFYEVTTRGRLSDCLLGSLSINHYTKNVEAQPNLTEGY